MLVVLLLVAAAVVAIVFLALAISRRRPSRDDGVASFQRHLGALSPEARRQVIDRVRKAEDGDSAPDHREGGR